MNRPLLRSALLLVCFAAATTRPGASAGDAVAAPAALAERQRALLDHMAGRDLPQGTVHTWVDQHRWSVAHARLVVNTRLDEANRYFSEVEFASLWHGLVADSDVQVTDLLRTWFEFGRTDRLSDAAKAHLRELFAGWGPPNTDRNRNADVAYEWPCEYTENHSLNILVARYLIDTALGRNRRDAQALLLRFLVDRAKFGWSEFNSPRYGMVTAKALVLLVDFAPDAPVRNAARMLLDLLVVDYASHAVGYWRGLPCSRGGAWVRDNSPNAFLPPARLWFDDENASPKGSGFIAHFCTTRYAPPAVARELFAAQETRPVYTGVQTATFGPSRTRVPVVIHATPHATLATAQGSGSVYDGAYVSMSFAASPKDVVAVTYGNDRAVFQRRNVCVAFGEVHWPERLVARTDGDLTLGGTDRARAARLDLGSDCSILVLADAAAHADLDAFAESVRKLDAAFDDGTVMWTMPDGEAVRAVFRRDGKRYRFVDAFVNGRPVRIDRNLLFDSPWLRSVRGSGTVELLHDGRMRVYDFTGPKGPTIRDSAATALSPLPPERIAGELGMTFVHIPPGEFVLGSPVGEGRSSERPQQWKTLDGFYISLTEVTAGQYAAFLDATDDAPDLPEWYRKEWAPTDRHPMGWVSWDDAVAFCEWLTDMSGVRHRLPTEAEWEKAAKGGRHRVYPWGDDYDGSQSGRPNGQFGPVASMPADRSPFGVYDMGGNLWEWCADAWTPSHMPPAERMRAELLAAMKREPRLRVLKGCGWNFDPDTFRCSYRTRFESGKRSVHIGFRVVRAVKPLEK